MTDTFVHLDPNGKDLTVEHVQDVQAILDWNKAARSQEQRSDWGRHVAKIPNVIMTKWLNEEWEKGNTTIRLFGDEMNRLVERKLKDPEWAFLRTDSHHINGFLGFGS